jgi:hypothetical protein
MGKSSKLLIGLVVAATLLAIAVPGSGEELPRPCAAVRLSRSIWDATRDRSLTARSPTPAEGSRSAEVDWEYQLDLDRGIFSRLSYLRIALGPRGSVRQAEFLPPT